MNNFLKKKRIKRNFNREVEPHEIFLDRVTQEKEGEFKKRFEVPIIPEKFFALKILFLLLLLVLLGKSLHLQIVEGEEFSILSQNNKERNYFTRAKRGVVYDKNMTQLVSNEAAFDLVVDKRDLPLKDSENKEVIEKVSLIISEDPNFISEKIKESELFLVPILENISHERLIVLEGKIDDFPGFSILENTTRNYLDESLSHFFVYFSRLK
jgi:cell division protein FtsI/penicillin-binding protein 2